MAWSETNTPALCATEQTELSLLRIFAASCFQSLAKGRITKQGQADLQVTKGDQNWFEYAIAEIPESPQGGPLET